MPENQELTTTEKDCLIAYTKHVERYGAPPSRRQLANALGIQHSAVTNTLKRLEKKGAIKLPPKRDTRTTTGIRLNAKAKKAVGG